MTKLLTKLWARFLFQDKGFLPTKRLLYVVSIISIALITGSAFGLLSWEIVIAVNVIVFLLSLLDFLSSASKNELVLRRVAPEEMERNSKSDIRIVVTNKSKHDMNFRLLDGVTPSFQTDFPLKGSVAGLSETIVTYDVNPQIRGKHILLNIYFRYTSRYGLWEKQTTVLQEDVVKVIPNLTDALHYLADPQKFLLHEGVKIRKVQRGTGEFSKIRNYVVGDDPRKINWRQTAKLQEVMTNEYEPEHGKYITILIDCGRMMGAELKEGNQLEKVLEAAITVCASALQKGDFVSVLAFSKDVKVYVPAAKGMGHLHTILQSIYNLEVDSNEPNYALVLQYLQSVQKKRSLLLLFSDVHTFLQEESALFELRKLRTRHLFLLIGIENEELVERTKDRPESVQKAMIKSMAQKQMLMKRREKIKWEKEGLLIVEAPEERLTSAAISRVIDIMNRGLL